eukprot:364390-Chlamydomonas_euryale.AAC.3
MNDANRARMNACTRVRAGRVPLVACRALGACQQGSGPYRDASLYTSRTASDASPHRRRHSERARRRSLPALDGEALSRCGGVVERHFVGPVEWRRAVFGVNGRFTRLSRSVEWAPLIHSLSTPHAQGDETVPPLPAPLISHACARSAPSAPHFRMCSATRPPPFHPSLHQSSHMRAYTPHPALLTPVHVGRRGQLHLAAAGGLCAAAEGRKAMGQKHLGARAAQHGRARGVDA